MPIVNVVGVGKVNFPDTMSSDEIKAVLDKQYSKSKTAAQPVAAPTATPEQIDATDRASRFGRGVGDPINGLAQMLFNAVPESLQNAGTKADQFLYDKTGGFLGKNMPFPEALKAEELQYQAARKATGQEGLDAYRMGGNIAGAIPIALATRKVPATTLIQRTVLGAGVGGATAATNPVYGEQKDYWSDKAKQVGVGTLLGGLSVPAADKIAGVIKPTVSSAAQKLKDMGMTLSPGQILGGGFKAAEEKLRSVPFFGDMITNANKGTLDQFNKAVYNRALAPIGKSADDLPVGREGVAAVKQALKNAYDDILPKLKFKADGQFTQELSQVKSMASTLPKKELSAFNKILQDKLLNKMTGSGTMSGDSLKVVESELGRMAKGYSKDPSFDARQLGDALSEVQRIVRANLIRSNPNHAAKLTSINEGYANYAIIRNAASKAGTEGGFTPAQLLQAIKSNDGSVGKGSFAAGQAKMQDLADAAKQVISNKYPDSGTAGRLAMGGGALAAGYLEPTVLGGILAGGGLYTNPAQKALQAMLMSRPAMAEPIANSIRLAAPSLGAATAGTVSPLLFP